MQGRSIRAFLLVFSPKPCTAARLHAESEERKPRGAARLPRTRTASPCLAVAAVPG
jgi:hypothetical protein